MSNKVCDSPATAEAEACCSLNEKGEEDEDADSSLHVSTSASISHDQSLTGSSATDSTESMRGIALGVSPSQSVPGPFWLCNNQSRLQV